MKIKEKGLSGKAAELRRFHETNIPSRSFNAFRQFDTSKKKDKKGGDKGKAEKPDVFLEFMGKKLKVIDEDGGRVDEAEVPYVKNSALKITGIEGNRSYDEVKVRISSVISLLEWRMKSMY